MTRLLFLCPVVLAVAMACHRQQGTGGASVRNVITQEQIDSTGYTNVYDVIARLHGEYLRDRGAVSIKSNQHARAVVFLDAKEYGIPETLRNFPVDIANSMKTRTLVLLMKRSKGALEGRARGTCSKSVYSARIRSSVDVEQ